MLSLREFTPTDYDAVLELWREAEGVLLREADTRESIAAFLARNPGLSFVALEDGELAGAALCGHDGRRGYLHHVAVSPRHRRRGIGTALVNACVNALQGQGIHKCHLFVVNGNLPAREFWERMGWSVRGDVAFLSRVLSGSGNA